MHLPQPWAVLSNAVCAGLLVAYCHRFDILTHSSRIYFVACTIGRYPSDLESGGLAVV